MNPTLYQGSDSNIKDLSQKMDNNLRDSKIDPKELQDFLQAEGEKGEANRQELLKQVLNTEDELRKINGLENAVRSTLNTLISSSDLISPLENLSSEKRAIVLLYEGLYGGKKLSAQGASTTYENNLSETGQDSAEAQQNNQNQTSENNRESLPIPELTPELWTKFTLKQSIKDVSGIPAGYASNLDDMMLSENNSIATIRFSLVQGGQFIDKRIKDNNNKNDNQTIIKFKLENAKWKLIEDQADTDLVLTDQGEQLMRFPGVGKNDKPETMSVSFTNGRLDIKPYIVDTSVWDTISNKGFGHGISLTRLEAYVGSDTTTATENKKPYYIAAINNNGKTENQQVLFDQDGLVLPEQYYTIKPKGQSSASFVSDPNNTAIYMKNVTSTSDGRKTSYNTNETYTTEQQDSNINSVSLLPDNLKNKGYMVDFVEQEGMYHIMQTPSGITKSRSVLSIPADHINKLADNSEKLPIYLNDDGLDQKYYLLSVKKAGDNKNTITLERNDSIKQQEKDLLEHYRTMLETKNTRTWFLGRTIDARHGSAQYDLRFNQPQVIHPKEDSYFDENTQKGKPYQLMFKTTLSADNLPNDVTIKSADIILQGKQVYGMPEDYNPNSNEFVATNSPEQKVIAETKYGLKSYVVGMISGKLHLEEEQTNDNIKSFLKTYKIESGEQVFENAETITLRDAKDKVLGYALDATIKGSEGQYIIFDLAGNVVDPNTPEPEDKKSHQHEQREAQQAIFTKTVPNKSTKETSQDDQIVDDVITDTIWSNVLKNLNTSYKVANKNDALLGFTAEGKAKNTLKETIESSNKTLGQIVEAGGYTLQGETQERKDIEGNTTGLAFTAQEGTISYKLRFNVNSDGTLQEKGQIINTTGGKLPVGISAEIIGNEKLIVGSDTEIKKAKEARALEQKNKALIKDYPLDNGTARFIRDEKVYEVNPNNAINHMLTLMKDDSRVNEIIGADNTLDYHKLANDYANYQTTEKEITSRYKTLEDQPWDKAKDYIKKNQNQYPSLYTTLNNNGDEGWAMRTEQDITKATASAKKAELDKHKSENREKSGLRDNMESLKGAAIQYMKVDTPTKFENYQGDKNEIKEETPKPQVKPAENINNNNDETPINQTENTKEIADDTAVQVKKENIKNNSNKTFEEGDKSFTQEASNKPQSNYAIYNQKIKEAKEIEGKLDNESDPRKLEEYQKQIVTLAQEADNVLPNQADAKNLIAMHKPASSESQETTTEHKIESLNLPRFEWSRYKPGNKPEPMTLDYLGKTYPFRITNAEAYNRDYSHEFNTLINLINTSSPNTEQYDLAKSFNNKMKGTINQSSTAKVTAIQSRSAEKGGIKSDDFDKYKLNDGKVGINTYIALLITLYGESGFSKQVADQFKNIEKYLTKEIVAVTEQMKKDSDPFSSTTSGNQQKGVIV